jgi:2-isopropylmalate synthase
MQVPPTYVLDSFVVTAGNTISASANLRLTRQGQLLSGVSLGDGPIDAAFLAIEQITGCHYELDDFQIQSVTEGREAMGQTVVKLRSQGKVYSGRGISTDIVGASILAYVNALNKIVDEEENV